MFSFREKHRQAVREKIFHPEWLQIIAKNVPYFRLLTPDEQRELQGLILVFLDEKSFEGCGGLEITGLKSAAYKLPIDDRQIGRLFTGPARRRNQSGLCAMRPHL